MCVKLIQSGTCQFHRCKTTERRLFKGSRRPTYSPQLELLTNRTTDNSFRLSELQLVPGYDDHVVSFIMMMSLDAEDQPHEEEKDMGGLA